MPVRPLAVVLAVLALAPTALGGDRELLQAKERYLPFAQQPFGSGPDGLQARYDAGRDLVEAVGRAGGVSDGCARLARQLLAYGRAQIGIAEAEDYPVKRAKPPLPRVTARCRPRVVGASTQRLEVWGPPLPPGADVARLPRPDAALAARLRRAAASPLAHVGVWVHHLRTGRSAGVNEDALVPGASTVKLAPLVAGLRGGDAYFYDVTQIGAWSSNLAANRIAARLGLGAIAHALSDLGMTRSTYPGLYRAGTARSPGYHTRVTTPRDLGRALLRLHAAALGHGWALRETRLTRKQAELAVATLRGTVAVGENRGLLQPSLGRTPLAQKNGWISDMRLTAAIVYARRGPVIVVVAGYDEGGVSEHEGIALGRRVLEAARLR